jgi:hypothetical protein
MRKLKRLNNPIPFRGGELSIQANEGAYSLPKSNHGPYTHVEVAFIYGDNSDMIYIPELKDRVDYCGEDEKFEDLTSCVHGYVLVERVKELLKEDGYSDENIEAIFHRINTVVEFR